MRFPQVALSLFITPSVRPHSLAQYNRGPKLLSWEAAVTGAEIAFLEPFIETRNQK